MLAETWNPRKTPKALPHKLRAKTLFRHHIVWSPLPRQPTFDFSLHRHWFSLDTTFAAFKFCRFHVSSLSILFLEIDFPHILLLPSLRFLTAGISSSLKFRPPSFRCKNHRWRCSISTISPLFHLDLLLRSDFFLSKTITIMLGCESYIRMKIRTRAAIDQTSIRVWGVMDDAYKFGSEIQANSTILLRTFYQLRL